MKDAGVRCFVVLLLVLIVVPGCRFFNDHLDASQALTVSELLADVDKDEAPDLLEREVVVKGILGTEEEGEEEVTYLQGAYRGVRLNEGVTTAEGDSVVLRGTLSRQSGLLVFQVAAAGILGEEGGEIPIDTDETQVAAQDSSSSNLVASAISSARYGISQASEAVTEIAPLLLAAVVLLCGLPIVFLRVKRKARGHSDKGQHRSVFQDAQEAMLLTDEHLNILETNPAAQRLIGRGNNRVGRLNLSSILKLSSGEDIQSLQTRAHAGVVDVDASIKRDEGNSLDLQVRISRLSVNGQDRLLCLLIDTTERKEREQLMKRLQQVILDEMPFEVAVLSPQGQYVFASAGLAGDAAARKAIIGKTDVEVCREAGLHNEVAVRRRAQRHRTVSSKQIVKFEETLTTPTGERHYVRYYTPVLNGRGDVSMIIAYGIDETEVRRLRRELTDTSEEIERLRRMKESFLQNLSHEFRTPLTGIMGAVQVVMDEVTPEQRELLEIAARNGNRLLKTLTDVLDLAGLQAADLQVNLTVQNVAEEVKAAVAEMHKPAEEKGLFLRVHAASQEVWARLDTACFRRAFGHLLENAIKFTETGGVVVDVDADEERVHVRVMDSGVGIAGQYLTTVYDEFTQESSGLARRFEGLGVGLSITERLMGLMDGTITAHSEKAGGSMFSITLPRVLVRADAGQSNLPSILVVEQERDEQRIFQYMLEPFCRVTFASDAARVVDIVGEGRCDGVLLNLDASADPADLVRRIRAHPGSQLTLLVGVGAQNLPGERERVLSMGFDEYLAKPVSKKALLNTLESLVALNQGLR